VFANVCHFHNYLIFVDKAKNVESHKVYTRIDSTLHTNIRLVRKCLTVTNTLAYYDSELIAVVKSCIVQAPGVLDNG
jgi:hypothetical protein